MSEHSSSNQRSSTETESSYSVRRYFRRHEGPRKWWPSGILPLLLLGLLFLFGLFVLAPDMQKDTEANVQSVLQEAGYTQLAVHADGQRVSISGTANPQDADIIKRVALSTTCDAFIAKDLICPTTVAVNLDAEELTRHHDFSFVRTAEGLVLRGDVPNADVHSNILEDAKVRFGAVIDSLRITEEQPDSRYSWASDKALSLLEGVNSGMVSWTSAVLSMSARTARDSEQQVRDMFTSMRFPERIGELNLLLEEEVNACNVQLEEALAETMIYFQTASAVISEGSQQQLDIIAGIANNCPGNLVVEGHTDNVGDDDSNLDLSKRRANAVVVALSQLGVSDGRLSAIGYGESRPVMSNETSQGRAMNRRIVIQVADFN